MIILGIHEGHDSGAAIVKDGKILAAVNEERLCRQKLYQGIPKLSINKVLELSKINKYQIDSVAISYTMGIRASLGWEKLNPYKKLYQFASSKTHITGLNIFPKIQRFTHNPFRNQDVKNYLKSIEINAPVHYIDHHKCHVASAYYTSGKDKCLIITSDGSGDGLSSSVYLGNNGNLKLIREVPTFHSIAYYYAYITYLAGFKMFKHEGKITGLAAHGNPNTCYHILEKCIGYNSNKKMPVNKIGLIGQDAICYLKKELSNYSIQDYSAAIQKRVEDITAKYVYDHIELTKTNDIALAGGLFANVKINQRILELPNVNSVFIHPHMGDGGLAVGAAFVVYSEYKSKYGSGFKPYYLNNVYFGPSYSNEEIEKIIFDNKLKAENIKNIEKYVAEKIKDKKIIGHFSGKMEYGPRALGNRSILADPTDKTINDWLNKRLHRTEFMPFAPSMLDTAAFSYYENYEKGKYPAKFMTITFNDTKEALKAKAVVHIDNTTRPQVVDKEQNPRYYKILKEYEKLTNLPIFINTSFNIHEEPIVCSPEDAIRSHLKGTTDVLILENWAIER